MNLYESIKGGLNESSLTDPVYTVCYNSVDIWDTRKDAMAFYKEGIYASDGSEKERYTNIYFDLADGETFAYDGDDNAVNEIIYRKGNGDIAKRVKLDKFVNAAEAIFDEQNKKEIKESGDLEDTPCEDKAERERRIKNVYLMDRILRSMNNEDAIDESSWLYYVADEDSDDGFDEFKERSLKYGSNDDYYYTDNNMYAKLEKMFTRLVKEYGPDGFLTKEFFKNHDDNWKENAGIGEEEIEYLKTFIPEPELINEAEIHTVDNDPLWKAAVEKVNAEYEEAKPEIIKGLKAELRNYVKELKRYGLSDEDIKMDKMYQAYQDAIKDPDDIWCECDEDYDPEYKETGDVYLGVEKDGYICPACMKYQQIG